MINANELRIGNFLLVNDVIEEVTHLKPNLVVFDKSKQKKKAFRFNDNVDGIPLTSERLEQCGLKFKKLPENYLGGNNGYEILIMSSAKRYLLLSGKNTLWWPCIYDSDNIYNGQSITKNVFELHQLQNLFFSLTGKELEVILK